MVDYSSLENYRTERYRGFESLSLRTKRCNRAEFQQIASLFFIVVHDFLLYTILNYFNIIYPFTLYTTDSNLNCFRNHHPKHTPLQYR